MFSLLKKTSKRLGYAIVAEIFVPFEFPRGWLSRTGKLCGKSSLRVTL